MKWFRKIRESRALAEKQRESDARRLIYGEIVRAYSTVLENGRDGFGMSRSQSDLPFDKSVIKAALVEEALCDGVPQERLNALGVGFMELGGFQPNGGGEGGLFGGKLNLSANDDAALQDFARQIAESGDAEEEMTRITMEERKALLDEWNRLVIHRASNHA